MKKRILVIKLLTLMTLAVTIVSHHIYDENTLVALTLEISSYIALFIAAMGRIWTSAYILGKKNKVLVTDGPYSIVRNPLYFFSFVGFVGAGLAFESIVIAVGMALVFFLTHWSTIFEEEKRLHGTFGKQYDEYVKTVPRFVPKPWRLINPQEVSFAPVMFSRAVLDCSLIAMATFSIAHIVEWAHVNSMLPILFRLF
jgi:protein-S-isoprenylcysteine O-methyltransferase Ste14